MKNKLISITLITLLILGSFGAIGSRVTKEDTLIDKNTSNIEGSKGVCRQALNVGVNHNLAHCDEDARALNRLLKKVSWPEENCELRTDNPDDGNTNVNVNDVKSKLNDMAENTDENSISLFSFSGHGGEEGDGTSSHICLKDGDLDADTISSILDKFYGDVVCIFDCCHAGGLGGSFSKEDVDLYVSNFLNTVGTFGKDNKNTNRVILMACALDETSWEVRDLNYTDEEKGAGLWTYFVWHGLIGHADTSDGKITAEEAFSYAEPKVVSYSDGDIHPKVSDEGPDDVILVGSGPVEGVAELTLTMLQIKEIDEIDPLTSAEWYYTAKMSAGNAGYTKTKYTPNGADTWNFNHDHTIEIDEPEVAIEIVVKEEDAGNFWIFKDDLADISSRTGPGPDQVDDEKWIDDEWFSDGGYEGAVYHGLYNVITGELTGDNYNRNGEKYVTSGDLDPDGSTNEDTNDAKVQFKITDSFDETKYKPEINDDDLDDINIDKAEKDKPYYRTLTIKNCPPSHDWADYLSKLEWDAEITKGSSWLSIESDYNGDIPVGESSEIRIKIDTEGWNNGETKTGTIDITSNDEYGNDDIDIDVTVSIEKGKSKQISNHLFEILRTLFPKITFFHLFFQ